MRKSNRLARNLNWTIRDADIEGESPSKAKAQEWSTGKKRKRSEDFDLAPNDDEKDGDFDIGNAIDDTESITSEEPDPESDLSPTPPSRTRRAANKARIAIQALAFSRPSKIHLISHSCNPTPPSPIDPDIATAVRAFCYRTPSFLKAPVLSPHRLVVDEKSVYLYAEEGTTNLWASALSSTRFNGPRRHPPFRELYRLTDPKVEDASDWAENIRWAKEQYRCFESVTWTEYDYHLEMITEHRREIHWVSEEAIKCGGLGG